MGHCQSAQNTSVVSHSTSSSHLENVRRSLIGNNVVISTPFGKRKMVYADYTSSGRAVSFIEDFIRDHVLPTYGNTHTCTSLAGAQTTRYRAEARAIVEKAVNASDQDVVLFVGSGSTAAMNHLCKTIFRHRSVEENYKSTVVFIGPFEHHSNILPWQESGAKVVFIKEDDEGKTGVDLKHLEAELKLHEDYPLKIGTFSIASNLTGIVTDCDQVTQLLKLHGALSFWDYAAGASYLEIDMNPAGSSDVPPELLQKDAIFISPHKMIAGVGTCGCLIVKKRILEHFSTRFEDSKQIMLPPVNPGGGTVEIVTEKVRVYFDDWREREEGGTPDIVGSIRAGLAFQLRQAIGIDVIHSLESDISSKVFQRLMKNEKLKVYGNPAVPFSRRLPIVSFNVKFFDTDLFLHHGFVCVLLNDLFGIQVRGGCGCAEPYGAALLDVKNDKILSDIQHIMLEDHLPLWKPGFCRLSFHFAMTDEEIEYICAAIEFVADHGWKFMPFYKYSASGAWTYGEQDSFFDECSLHDVVYSNSGRMEAPLKRETLQEKQVTRKFADYLEEANKLAQRYATIEPVRKHNDDDELLRRASVTAKALKWFVLPSECLKTRQLHEA